MYIYIYTCIYIYSGLKAHFPIVSVIATASSRLVVCTNQQTLHAHARAEGGGRRADPCGLGPLAE